MDFEKNLKRLEEIVAKLEDGELQLEESLKLFEEGISISRACNQKLTEAENRVKILLNVNGDSTEVTKDFTPE
jgi:exodeoxyribonuclease VII small subunit